MSGNENSLIKTLKMIWIASYADCPGWNSKTKRGNFFSWKSSGQVKSMQNVLKQLILQQDTLRVFEPA